MVIFVRWIPALKASLWRVLERIAEQQMRKVRYEVDTHRMHMGAGRKDVVADAPAAHRGKRA
jgi:hypothetical protein